MTPNGSSKRPVDEAESSHRELDHRIMRGSMWVAVGHGGRQGLAMLSMLVLARLLEPRAFGLVALAWALLFVIERIQESGISSALIHRRENIDEAAASVFLFAPLMGFLLYVVTFFATPLYARIVDAPELTSVLRVLALLLLIRGFSMVPGALLEREIDFRRRTILDLAGGFTQLGVSIGLAVVGFGVWSLVGGHLAGSTLRSALAWVVVKYRPSLGLASWGMLRDLLRYGRYVGAANLLHIVVNNLDTALISRLLGPAAVGLYSVPYRLANMPNVVIGHIVGRVMFPIYAMVQHDYAVVRRAYVENLQRIALLSLPVSVALALAAEPVVLGLLGPQWESSVDVLRILAVYGLVRSFISPAGEVWKGIGRPEFGLYMIIAFGAVLAPALFLLAPRLGLVGAALALLAAQLITGAVAMVVTVRLIDLDVRHLARSLAPSGLCSVVMGAAVAALLPVLGAMHVGAALALVAVVGSLVYVAATAAFARSVVVPMWVNLRGARPEAG